MRQRDILRIAVPCGVLAFCWLTMGVTAANRDESMTSYGFPMSWYSPSLISSGTYNIAIGPMAADLAAYLLLSQLLWNVILTRGPVFSIVRGQLLGVLLSIAASASVVLSLLAFSIDPVVVPWKLDSYFAGNSSKSRFVALGLQPRAARAGKY